MSNLLLPSSTLEQKQPIYKVESNCLISKNGDVTVGYEMTLPEVFTIASSDYDTYHAAWVKALALLPINSVVHKQDWYVQTPFQSTRKEKGTMLSRSYDKHFAKRPFLDHKCYLYITKTPSDRSSWSSLAGLLTRSKIVPKDSLDEKAMQTFFDAVGQFIKILQDSGVGFTQLLDDDLAGNEDQLGVIEKYLALDQRDTAPMVDLDFRPGAASLKVGSKLCQCYAISNLDDLPNTVQTNDRYDKYSTEIAPFPLGFAAHVGLLLPVNHIYNQYLFIDDSSKTIRGFEKKRDNMQSMAQYSRQNEINKQFLDAHLNDAASLNAVTIRAHCNLLVWTENERELAALRNLTSTAITKMNCRPRESTVDIGALFWAGIPGNAGDFPSEETFFTFMPQAVCFLAMETNYRDTVTADSNSGMMLSDRISGRPVAVDLSDAPMKKGLITNRNKFVLGPSGSGKSFFTNAMVRSYYDAGTHVVIVDIGNSYKGLCEMVKGVYFTYEEHKPIQFNPFWVKGGRPSVEKKESLITLLQTLWKKDDEVSTRSEYVSLSTAVSMYYDKLNQKDSTIAPKFNTFYEFCQSDFAAYLKSKNVRNEDFDLQNFLYVLSSFYQGGSFDYLLNSEKDLDLIDRPFIVFELDNIKDNPILFPVVTLIIMETFITKMRALKGVRKMILIEEAWKAIAKEGTAEFIKYLFKTVRKFYGEAIVVTQEVDDILSSPIVKDAILNSSDCKILLDQAKFVKRFDGIEKMLGLTDKMKAQILSINKNNDPTRKYKEVFISLGDESKVYATEVSLEEYCAYTTEELEKKRLNEFYELTGDMDQAILLLADEMRTRTRKSDEDVLAYAKANKGKQVYA